MSKPKYSIIPKPQSYTVNDGTYTVTPDTQVLCIPEFIKAGKYLSAYLKTKNDANNGAIKFNKDASLKAEAYKLKITGDEIVISASDENGAFYGAVTLKIMLMQAKTADGVATLNCCDIYDYPKYGYRGGMLDESRHFFGVDTVKKLLDNLALLKFNKFHWHLSDDQGYRIESEVYPLMNEIGSKREFEHFKSNTAGASFAHEGGEYFHYYKKDEIREIVEYAKNLCIDIIPEIDLPGHTVAFIAAYNELSCMKEGYKVACENGVFKDIICAGSEETYEFVENLLSEVCELFPYEYFHIGGDEASKGHKIWEKDCPKCKKVMEENGLKNGAELQGYFTNRISKFLKSKGKTSIMWNDGVCNNIDSDIVGQYWTFCNPVWVKRENDKRKFIISPCPTFYYDITYAGAPLKTAYNYKPAKSGFTNDKNILGLEFETWTEWITNESALEFSIYPRIFASAENSWTEDAKMNYKDFYKRLNFFKAYMDTKGINYSRVEGKVWFKIKNKSCYHLGDRGPEYKYSEQLKSN